MAVAEISSRQDGALGDHGVASPRTLTLATAAAAAVATGFAAAVPALRIAGDSETARIAIETAATVIAFLAAFLFYGRFQRTCRLFDLAVLAALEIIALTNLCFSTLPAIAGFGTGPWSLWASIGGRLLGGAVFAATALLRDRPVRNSRRAELTALLLGATTIAALGATVAAVEGSLPATLTFQTTSAAALAPTELPGVFILQLLDVLLFAMAAIGFTRRAQSTEEPLLKWFAVGSTLAAFARVNYLLFPATFFQVVGTGDVLRLLFYLAVLVGVLREIARYQQSYAESAVLAERRRLARELHDGLAQELAFLAGYARLLAKRGGDASPSFEPLVAAAERALDESRGVVRELSQPAAEPFAASVERTAREVAVRAGVPVSVEIDQAVEPEPAIRHGLLRIIREAVANAAVHSRASEIAVRILAGRPLRISVSDNGVGFDPVDVREDSFGLTSMQERSEALGGWMEVVSAPGHGTRIEVTI